LKRRLFLGSRSFVLERGYAPSTERPGHATHRLNLLRRLAAEPGNRRQLRRFLVEIEPGLPVDRLDDAAVLVQVERALIVGRASLVEGPALMRLVGLDGDVAGEPPPPASARAAEAALTWIEIKLIGEDDKPIPGEAYRVELVDGSVREGRLDAEGFVRIDQIDPGTCTVTFPALDEEAWQRI
jgi:hypothetical protein